MKRIMLTFVLLGVLVGIGTATPALADPSRNNETIALSCDNGFTGTLIAIPFTPIQEAQLVSDGTNAFIIVSTTAYAPDNTLLGTYTKPGLRSGQAFTNCTFNVTSGPGTGVHGTVTGYFTPIG